MPSFKHAHSTIHASQTRTEMVNLAISALIFQVRCELPEFTMRPSMILTDYRYDCCLLMERARDTDTHAHLLSRSCDVSKWNMGIEITPRESEASTNFCEAQVRSHLLPRPSLLLKHGHIYSNICANRGERLGTGTLQRR